MTIQNHSISVYFLRITQKTRDYNKGFSQNTTFHSNIYKSHECQINVDFVSIIQLWSREIFNCIGRVWKGIFQCNLKFFVKVFFKVDYCRIGLREHFPRQQPEAIVERFEKFKMAAAAMLKTGLFRKMSNFGQRSHVIPLI